VKWRRFDIGIVVIGEGGGWMIGERVRVDPRRKWRFFGEESDGGSREGECLIGGK
jgi:hypothetical protein